MNACNFTTQSRRNCASIPKRQTQGILQLSIFESIVSLFLIKKGKTTLLISYMPGPHSMDDSEETPNNMCNETKFHILKKQSKTHLDTLSIRLTKLKIYLISSERAISFSISPFSYYNLFLYKALV
jgi:hypothetical protein